MPKLLFTAFCFSSQIDPHSTDRQTERLSVCLYCFPIEGVYAWREKEFVFLNTKLAQAVLSNSFKFDSSKVHLIGRTESNQTPKS